MELTNKYKAWKPEEDQVIIDNWKRYSDEKLAIILKRPVSGVAARRKQVLGIHRPPNHSNKLRKERKRVRDLEIKSERVRLAVAEMQALIEICEDPNVSSFKKEQCKAKLRILSGIKNG